MILGSFLFYVLQGNYRIWLSSVKNLLRFGALLGICPVIQNLSVGILVCLGPSGFRV